MYEVSNHYEDGKVEEIGSYTDLPTATRVAEAIAKVLAFHGERNAAVCVWIAGHVIKRVLV